MDCSPPDSSVHEVLQARILEWVAIPFFRGSSWPGFKPRSPGLQADSLPSEPPGKPKYTELLHFTTFLCPWDFPGKNAGVACNFLLHRTFPTQWFNVGLVYLLHCRQILYLLSHWGRVNIRWRGGAVLSTTAESPWQRGKDDEPWAGKPQVESQLCLSATARAMSLLSWDYITLRTWLCKWNEINYILLQHHLQIIIVWTLLFLTQQSIKGQQKPGLGGNWGGIWGGYQGKSKETTSR